ncbi:MAG: O-methyltransferase [Thaumarchaeota archaeon]|nr:O-methyltransferase [Nitrososphaerota archaeon]
MSHDTYPEIVSPPVEKYLYGILRPRQKVLAFLEKDAEKNNVPIVGPLVGNLLAMLAMSCNAKNILEIGTATGYSGIWLAEVAMKNGGRLTTIEADPSRIKLARKSFEDSGLGNVVEIVKGDAKAEVPRIARANPGMFDLAFIDVGDKSLYVDLLKDCIQALKVGGFLVADNTLWRGQVANLSAKDVDTKTLREYNKRVYADNRLHPIIVPLRDGVTVAMKLVDT